MTTRHALAAAGALMLVASHSADAQKQYGPGASDTEVKIGQTMPYSGPASAYGTQGRIEEAYYAMINAKGGVNGRKITMISLDDAYSPPKTVEQTRRLVEQDEVLAIVGTIGTPTNSATQKYLNLKKVPQLFISTGAAKWDDPKNFPWTTQLYPPYQMEGMIFAKYLLKNRPNARLGVFSQNDDAGKDYVKGLKDGLGESARTMIVKEVTYEVSEPTIDSQIVTLKAAGVDTLFTMATPKFGAQAIRKVHELGWKPLNFVVSVSSSIKGVMEPAGLEASKDVLTALAFKVPTDPNWESAADVKEFKEFLAKWYPRGDIADGSNVTGYISAYMTAKIIEMCGDNLSRDNLLKQATTLNKVVAPLLLPGISISTRPDRYAPYTQMQIAKFDGRSWVPEGPIFNTEAPGE
ncbi:ABC transporter substrate-binding protein [Tardiphaga sp.]|uniref:ABC transporter substrate-binding protein n=1 Tax=Tardiphaga sp. TaxID=1926292 RepID=UPI0025DF080B|nr:ABC transporter substrate-binding protein [Tardiphaga sp.]